MQAKMKTNERYIYKMRSILQLSEISNASWRLHHTIFQMLAVPCFTHRYQSPPTGRATRANEPDFPFSVCVRLYVAQLSQSEKNFQMRWLKNTYSPTTKIRHLKITLSCSFSSALKTHRQCTCGTVTGRVWQNCTILVQPITHSMWRHWTKRTTRRRRSHS